MPVGPQEGLNINEANVTQQGLNTLAAQSDATEGDIPSVGADGRVTFAGGALPDEWTVDDDGNLTIAPERGTSLAFRRLTVKLIDPGEYASVYAPGENGTLLGRAIAVGPDGNDLVLALVRDDQSTASVAVVGTTITATYPDGTTFGDLVVLLEGSDDATALAEFSTEVPDDTASFPGSFEFTAGRAAGAYVGFRGDNSCWYVRANGGVDIESADGDFIGQIDLTTGAYFRQNVGTYAALTVVDVDYSEILRVDASGVGFNGKAPARPQISATPDAQAIVDALVTLGLVTQAT